VFYHALIGGHTYSVRARGFVYNTWSDFGVACNITISNLPNGAEARESASEINVEFENKSSLSSNFASQELLAYPNPFENSQWIYCEIERKHYRINIFI
jgi:hypothetical protein